MAALVETRARLLVCAGSARADSQHRKLARAAEAALIAAGAEATFVEIGEYDLPLYNQDIEEAAGTPAAARELRDMLVAHDGLALASPEYNGSYSPLLKNTIDWVSRPMAGERHSAAFHSKVAGLMSTAPGPGGGREGLRHLRELLEWLNVTVIPEQLAVPRSSQAFDAAGNLARPSDIQAMQVWGEQLVNCVQLLKSAAK